MHRPGLLASMLICWLAVACGQKGPPLAPLHLVPAAVSEPAVRRVGDRVRLRFVLPNRNENGPGPLELDRVEIYAMTVAPDGEPSAREVMSKEHLVGQVAVRPVLAEGEQPAPDEKRPEPGTAVTFDEDLTAAKLTPEPVKDPVKPAAPPAGRGAGPGAPAAPPSPGAAAPAAVAAPATTPPAAVTPPAAAAPPATVTPTAPTPPATAPAAAIPPATTAPAAPGAAPPAAPAAAPPPVRTHVRRIYMARGMTRGGRPGTASPPLAVPVVDPPAPAIDVKSRVTERVVAVEWTAAGEGTTYNVYLGDDVVQPLNSAPLKTPAFEHTGAAFGQEQCYRVRSIAVVDGVSLEGAPSAPHCVTPRDTFPPAAPAGLAAVPTPGQISLIWNANAEPDLGGYVVLRGDAPDGPLQPLTAAPIRETSYRDTTVKPGVRYVYAIVAVDAATPANASPPSARVEETAR